MDCNRRNLPHYYPPGAIIFLTWRLFDSTPLQVIAAANAGQKAYSTSSLSAGQAFVYNDRLLDRATSGARYLQDPRIAKLLTETLRRGANEYGLYELYCWVVMPNHVHLVMRPLRDPPQIMRWIKGSSARASNLLLGRTGRPFWQYESYDHRVRSDEELNRIIRYVERNPVSAGLARSIEEWPWSSANAGQKAYLTGATRRDLAVPGVSTPS